MYPYDTLTPLAGVYDATISSDGTTMFASTPFLAYMIDITIPSSLKVVGVVDIIEAPTQITLSKDMQTLYAAVSKYGIQLTNLNQPEECDDTVTVAPLFPTSEIATSTTATQSMTTTSDMTTGGSGITTTEQTSVAVTELTTSTGGDSSSNDDGLPTYLIVIISLAAFLCLTIFAAIVLIMKLRRDSPSNVGSGYSSSYKYSKLEPHRASANYNAAILAGAKVTNTIRPLIVIESNPPGDKEAGVGP